MNSIRGIAVQGSISNKLTLLSSLFCVPFQGHGQQDHKVFHINKETNFGLHPTNFSYAFFFESSNNMVSGATCDL
jgi:hypothetical protein